MLLRLLLFFAVALSIGMQIVAADDMARPNAQAVRQWQNRKYGMFIHLLYLFVEHAPAAARISLQSLVFGEFDDWNNLGVRPYFLLARGSSSTVTSNRTR
jgi:hypothetical protein